jgi:hypothetical protein
MYLILHIIPDLMHYFRNDILNYFVSFIFYLQKNISTISIFMDL